VDPTRTITPVEAVLGEYGYYVAIRWQTVALAHIIEFTDLRPAEAAIETQAGLVNNGGPQL